VFETSNLHLCLISDERNTTLNDTSAVPHAWILLLTISQIHINRLNLLTISLIQAVDMK